MPKKIAQKSIQNRASTKRLIRRPQASVANAAKKSLWNKLSIVSSPVYNVLSWGWNSLLGGGVAAPTAPAIKEKSRRRFIHQSLSATAARLLRRRYILAYPKNTARVVFSKRWMKQAVRWDFVGVSLSKFWGKLNSRPLPVWARRPIYEMWGRVFRCNMDEVRDPLHTYPTLAAFFARELKDGAREICKEGMVSPVDGKVLACGEVTADSLEHIKGKTYSLLSFLGAKVENLLRKGVDEAAKKQTKLYHCVIYLSPGDYHRIHFPVDCQITTRKHFPGTLFPVSSPFLRLIPSIFALNERVVLMGEWERGFFSLTAVGAYNVGSITINFDDAVQTNNIKRDYVCPNLEYFSWNGMGSHAHERNYSAEGNTVVAGKGDECGQFHFGSTVVLVFEAESFEFSIRPGM